MRGLPNRRSINSPMLSGLVLALSLHGLLLSWHHIRQRTQPKPASLRVQDNTPVLLEVSSLPQPPTGLNGLPPIKSSQLPPPPSALPPPVQSRFQRPLSASGVGRPSHQLKSQAAKATRSVRLATANKSREWSNSSIRGQLGFPVFSAKGLSEALVHLNRQVPQRERQEAASGSIHSTSPKQSLDQSLGVVKTIEPGEDNRYLKLWNLGRPFPLPQKWQLPRVDKTLEVREITLMMIRSQDIGLRHAEIVRLQDRTFLFWVDEEKIFLLMTLSPQSSQP